MSGISAQASPPTNPQPFEGNSDDFHKVPAPRYRYATPSAPWPWMKFNIDVSEVHPVPPALPGKLEWSHYPSSLFENWTREEVNRSQMLTKGHDCKISTVYKLTVFDDGHFDDQRDVRTVRRADAMDIRAYWNDLVAPPPLDVRVQALFVEDMTLPVLQMLGTRYNIEPFFFASSTNWIPSRYQEDAKALEDHITVILPFIRTLKNLPPVTRTQRLPTRFPTITPNEAQSQTLVEGPLPYAEDKELIINTQAPLQLPDNKIMLQDLLSLHMVRNTSTSTIISCHPSLQFQGTSAKRLKTLVERTGDSVYWSKIFKKSKDPTLLLLAILWYPLYAWDESFEVLFRYINTLESDVLQFYDIKLTRELHKLQAHVLYYQQLLREFCRSVEFIRDTPNPAMSVPLISKEAREESAKILHAEANNLISEIERLILQREMLSERLDNAIRLTFATVNIAESKGIQELAEVTVKDSSAVKQIAYLSLVFLPATYLANVFSMNVTEINPSTTGTLLHYIETVVGLTLLTSWSVVALQKDSHFYPPDSGVLHRALWPLYYVNAQAKRWSKRV